MIKSLEQAIEKIRRLPSDRQEYAARLLEDIAAAEMAPTLSDAERAAVRVGLADLEAGRIVPEEEMAAFWARHER